MARRIETRMVDSVEEVDRLSARALHRLAQHHYLNAQRSGIAGNSRAPADNAPAADNLERAAVLSRQNMKTATQDAKETRIVSGKLIKGAGYDVDEVGRGFESLGKQVEAIGNGIETSATQNVGKSSPNVTR